jgi:fatty-acid desaturase
MLSNNRHFRLIGELIASAALAVAVVAVIVVLHRLNVHRPDDAGMRAMLCMLLALVSTKAIRTAMDRWAQEQKLIPLLVFDGSVATAISCLFWLIFYA